MVWLVRETALETKNDGRNLEKSLSFVPQCKFRFPQCSGTFLQSLIITACTKWEIWQKQEQAPADLATDWQKDMGYDADRGKISEHIIPKQEFASRLSISELAVKQMAPLLLLQ